MIARQRPKIGLLGVMQELYDDMIPGITDHQAAYRADHDRWHLDTLGRNQEMEHKRQHNRAAGQTENPGHAEHPR